MNQIVVAYNTGWLFEDCGKIDEFESAWKFERQLRALLQKWLPEYECVIGSEDDVKYIELAASDSDAESQAWQALNNVVESCDWIVER